MNRAMNYRYERIARLSNGLRPVDRACPAHGSDLVWTARSTVRFSRTLPSLPLRRVFCCLPARPIRIPRQALPERETRIPGLALERRVPKRAGPAGGNEAMSRTPMAERTH